MSLITTDDNQIPISIGKKFNFILPFINSEIIKFYFAYRHDFFLFTNSSKRDSISVFKPRRRCMSDLLF